MAWVSSLAGYALGEFSGFAKEIDERVEVRCVMAPPDPHPDDLWCQWEFRLKG